MDEGGVKIIKNQHFIRFRYPSRACNIYLVTANGFMPRLVYVDKNGMTVVKTTERIVPTGSLIQNSKKCDAYGNKNVQHAYADGDIDITLPFIGAEVGDSNDGIFQMAYIRCGTVYNRLCYKTCDKPSHSTNGYYYIVDHSGRDTYQYRVLETTTNILLATFTGGYNYFRFENRRAYYSEWSRCVTTARGRSSKYKFTNYYKPVSNTVTGKAALYIGSFTAGDLRRVGLAISNICSFEYFYPRSILPDSFSDDLFTQFGLPDVNNCENLTQLREIKKNIPPILAVIRKHNVRSLSQFYLWYKYSYQTTLMDLLAYYKFFVSWASQAKSRKDFKRTSLTYNGTSNFGRRVINVTTRYHVYTSTYNAGVLEMMGLNLNLSNSWDMIPFSFVVDWFVNIGDILSRIDVENALAKVKVYSVCQSTKGTQTYSPDSVKGAIGSISVTTYVRDVSNTLPTGNITLSTKNPARHIIDGSALYYANKH